VASKEINAGAHRRNVALIILGILFILWSALGDFPLVDADTIGWPYSEIIIYGGSFFVILILGYLLLKYERLLRAMTTSSGN
jgi:hypothetical protein